MLMYTLFVIVELSDKTPTFKETFIQNNKGKPNKFHCVNKLGRNDNKEFSRKHLFLINSQFKINFR